MGTLRLREFSLGRLLLRHFVRSFGVQLTAQVECHLAECKGNRFHNVARSVTAWKCAVGVQPLPAQRHPSIRSICSAGRAGRSMLVRARMNFWIRRPLACGSAKVEL